MKSKTLFGFLVRQCIKPYQTPHQVWQKSIRIIVMTSHQVLINVVIFCVRDYRDQSSRLSSNLRWCLVWFDALFHEECEYGLEIDFCTCFNRENYRRLSVKMVQKTCFWHFTVKSNSILSQWKQKLFAKVIFIEMLRIKSCTNAENFINVDD
jgi:hypothetical protein